MSGPAGRVIVIGGSLAGLFAGLLLRRQFTVDIFERADAGLAGRGAGIVTHALLGPALSPTRCWARRSTPPGSHGNGTSE
jgi:2-polyprenyl-6-methoxyphenol hydroxylase-like FAD-dependent oxidoreductase